MRQNLMEHRPMLRNIVLVLGALSAGVLSGIGYAKLVKSPGLPDAQTPAKMQVITIAEPAANISQAPFNAENKLKQPQQSTLVQSEGAATETSAVARVEPAKPTATKPRTTPRLILGIGW